MWGAVIGDIIGSAFEVENTRSPFFELFGKGSRFTDDTVTTAAVADIVLKNWPNNLTPDEISDQLRIWCCSYLTRGFGSMFYQWIGNGVNEPYNSYGNGALMRVSSVAKFGIMKNLTKEETLLIAKKITHVTHNHPQALNAVDAYISMLYDLLDYRKKNKAYMPLEDSKNVILETLKSYNIPEPKKIIEYRIDIDFNLTCNHSLGVACAAILETNNFEDVMYQVVSAGGDSDTYAAIAGALAETIYGIDENMLGRIQPFFKKYDYDILKAIDAIYSIEDNT